MYIHFSILFLPSFTDLLTLSKQYDAETGATYVLDNCLSKTIILVLITQRQVVHFARIHKNCNDLTL